MNTVLRLLILLFGFSLIAWSYYDSRFRDIEGFINKNFCFSISIGIAFIILGAFAKGRLKRFAFWFVLALAGQAVALQLINAGTSIHYQHYKPYDRLLTETHPLLLIFLTVQTALVAGSFRKLWPDLREWVGRNFKFWQIVAMGMAFFITSATVSRDVRLYVFELFFATFLQIVNLVNIVLMVRALPDEMLDSFSRTIEKFTGQSKKKDLMKQGNLGRFAIFAAVWVTVLASILAFFCYESHPHIPDEVVYLYQARYFANGMLSVPAPPVPEAFSFHMIPYKSPIWYSIFPPGWPAVLAIGVILKVPWLVNPILAGLNILLVYILFLELSSRRNACLAVFLLSVSPWYIFMAMNFMSHTFTLTCALTAAVVIARSRRSGRAIWGWLGGSAAGMVSLIRPLDGLIVAGILGLWAIGVGGRRLKGTSIAAFIISTILVGSFIFLYNMKITGHPTTFPLEAYYEEYYAPKANALGFGPERGLGWPIDPFPGHSLIDALINANLNISSINIELFGWSTGSLILIFLLLFSKSKQRNSLNLLFITAVIAGTYSLYWFSGGPDFGARYWFLMIVPIVALTIKGLRFLQEKLETEPVESTINTKRIIAAVLVLSMLAVINYFPWRAVDKYYHYRGMRPDIRYLANEYNFGRSLVLIRGNDSDYLSAWTYNPLDPYADEPVYAWDRGVEVRSRLLMAYSDRNVWIVDGPSVTKGAFKIIEGPILAQNLLKKEFDIKRKTY